MFWGKLTVKARHISGNTPGRRIIKRGVENDKRNEGNLYCRRLFLGLEKYLGNIPGVTDTEVGYANGKTASPSYEDVCHRDTGHAETVRLTYDPSKISLLRLLSLYYQVIDPTSMNRQGNDVGSQYRTGVYYTDPEELPAIRQSVEALQRDYKKAVVIEIKPLENFIRQKTTIRNILIKIRRILPYRSPLF